MAMGTGYTYGIFEGKYNSPKDFVKECLRNFGVLIHMRDDPLYTPIPTEITTDSYYQERVKEAKANYTALMRKSPMCWELDYNSALSQAALEKDEQEAKSKEEAVLLRKYVDAVSNWDCDPEYQGVKDFALQQLSITEPSPGTYAAERYWDLYQGGLEEYKKNTLEQARKDIDYAEKSLKEEMERNADRNRFLQGFFKDLEKMEC